MISGFLNIDKAAGLTSHDVVAQVRRLTKQKRVGHGGTLDPAATGVLPVALGDATRLVEYLVDGTKAYRAAIRLGNTTTTDDAEGQVVEERQVPELAVAELEQALRPFIGQIMQVPPMYSAIQIDGQRMYNLARRGEVRDLPARPVEISRITVVKWTTPTLTVDIECGKGTYIRSLARDLGAALGCGAHLAVLRRTRVGPLGIEQAVTLEHLQAEPTLLEQALLPPQSAVADWPQVVVDAATEVAIGHGRSIVLEAVQGSRAVAFNQEGRLLALLEAVDERWQPTKVFAPQNQK